MIARLVQVAALLLLMPGCALLGNSVKTQGFAAEDVIGVWRATDAQPQQLRVEHLAFLPDGRKCSVHLGFSPERGASELRSLGRWQLIDDVIVTQLEYSGSAWLMPGDVLRHRLISASTVGLQMEWDTDELSQPRVISSYQRASGVSADALCAMAGPREQAQQSVPAALPQPQPQPEPQSQPQPEPEQQPRPADPVQQPQPEPVLP